MKKLFILVITVTVVLGIIFITNKKNQITTTSAKIKVSVSFYPLYFFASEVGGDKADVVNITPSNTEPHDYEPTAHDIINIQESDILILNGIVEPWAKKIKQSIDSNHTLVVTAGKNLMAQRIVKEGKETLDPHIWLAPPLAKQMVERIMHAFIKVDPQNTNSYTANAQILQSQLDKLHSAYRQELANCTKRDIITSHAAFGYLANAYNLKQIAIAGLSPGEEPSPRQLADIADFAKKNNAKVIFFEELISPKLAQTIATEVGAETLVLNPLEGLGHDKIIMGDNYLTEMRQNLINLKIALECTP